MVILPPAVPRTLPCALCPAPFQRFPSAATIATGLVTGNDVKGNSLRGVVVELGSASVATTPSPTSPAAPALTSPSAAATAALAWLSPSPACWAMLQSMAQRPFAACLWLLLAATPLAAPLAAQRLALHTGWQIQSSAQVTASGAALSTPGFPTPGWLPASVPSTWSRTSSSPIPTSA